MKRQKPVRPLAVRETPLDVGMRLGPELWTALDGVRFCHWDRWLLRLAVEEPDGLGAITERLASRVRSAERVDETAEALLTQARDLQARIASLSLIPTALLTDEERGSTWLLRKATRRIWDASSVRLTDAMRRTPRNMFVERARTGWWSNPRAFPVSPSPYYRALVSPLDLSSFDDRVDARIVSAMTKMFDRFLARAANDDEWTAIVRAYLTASADAIERLDTDGFSLVYHLDLHAANYFDRFLAHVDVPERRRELLEFAVWEGYGLLTSFVAFLRNVPLANRAAIATIHGDLLAIAAELRDALLNNFAESAERLATAIAAPGCESLPTSMEHPTSEAEGSDRCEPP